MPRPILEESRIHPAIRDKVANNQREILAEVQAAIDANSVVVVGMSQNPYPKKARKALDAAGVKYAYLEYGSYLTDWRRRNALKMWTGWPTFPMIFVNKQFIGGYENLTALLADGEFTQLLAAG